MYDYSNPIHPSFIAHPRVRLSKLVLARVKMGFYIRLGFKLLLISF